MKSGVVALRALTSGAARVVAGIREIGPFVSDVLPVPDDDLAVLTVPQRIASIALLKRFEQLQDLVTQMARLWLTLELERVDRMTGRDLANQMEKFEVVEDADDWVALREIRNNLVHEYPVGGQERADRVNECWALSPKLIEIEEKLRTLFFTRGHLA